MLNTGPKSCTIYSETDGAEVLRKYMDRISLKMLQFVSNLLTITKAWCHCLHAYCFTQLQFMSLFTQLNRGSDSVMAPHNAIYTLRCLGLELFRL